LSWLLRDQYRFSYVQPARVCSALFPYTTLFRSGRARVGRAERDGDVVVLPAPGGVVGRDRGGRVVEHRHLRVRGARGHLDVAGLDRKSPRLDSSPVKIA